MSIIFLQTILIFIYLLFVLFWYRLYKTCKQFRFWSFPPHIPFRASLGKQKMRVYEQSSANGGIRSSNVNFPSPLLRFWGEMMPYLMISSHWFKGTHRYQLILVYIGNSEMLWSCWGNVHFENRFDSEYLFLYFMYWESNKAKQISKWNKVAYCMQILSKIFVTFY